jgi:hypothetical protein
VLLVYWCIGYWGIFRLLAVNFDERVSMKEKESEAQKRLIVESHGFGPDFVDRCE